MIGFLFDNDGVLIDSSALHWLSWQLIMKEDPAFQMTHEAFVQGFGKRNELILKEVVPDAPQKHEQWAKRKEAFFREAAQGKVQLLPGMEGFLQQVKARHIPRIIASSTPVENLKMYLDTTVLGSYFDAFVSGEEVAQGKPAPDIFLEAAARLGIPPERCVVFEDAPAGIAAGKAAGCFVVALATTHREEELKGYDLLVPLPSQLNCEVILQTFHKKRG